MTVEPMSRASAVRIGAAALEEYQAALRENGCLRHLLCCQMCDCASFGCITEHDHAPTCRFRRTLELMR